MSNDEGSVTFTRKGCWNETRDRALPVLLLTDRDPTSHVYTNKSIQWSPELFPGYLSDLAYRCAKKAYEANEVYFGLEYYGKSNKSKTSKIFAPLHHAVFGNDEYLAWHIPKKIQDVSTLSTITLRKHVVHTRRRWAGPASKAA